VTHIVPSSAYTFNQICQLTEPDIEIHRKKDGEENYVEITNANNKVLPGEYIDLKLVADNVTAYAWTVPDNDSIVEDWEADETTGTTLTELEAGDLDNQTVVYYWHDDGDNQKVNCQVIINNKSYSIDVTFHVKKPTCNFTATDKSDVQITDSFYLAGTWLAYGGRGDPCVPGVEFEAEVTVPQGFSEGHWQFVQVLMQDLRWEAFTGGKMKKVSSDWALDNKYPYKTETETDEEDTAIDSPGVQLPSALIKKYTADMDFKMFVMFKPSGDNSIYVSTTVRLRLSENDVTATVVMGCVKK
jgi:hypothetical protein